MRSPPRNGRAQGGAEQGATARAVPDEEESPLTVPGRCAQVWLAFVSPSLIASRHGISASGGPVEALTKALERFTDAAVKP